MHSPLKFKVEHLFENVVFKLANDNFLLTFWKFLLKQLVKIRNELRKKALQKLVLLKSIIKIISFIKTSISNEIGFNFFHSITTF